MENSNTKTKATRSGTTNRARKTGGTTKPVPKEVTKIVPKEILPGKVSNEPISKGVSKKEDSKKVKKVKEVPIAVPTEEEPGEEEAEICEAGTCKVEETKLKSEDEDDVEELPAASSSSNKVATIQRVKGEKLPNVFELYTEEGSMMKIVFDILYNVMGSELSLIITRAGVYYSSADAGGQVVIQFCLE